MLKIVTTLTHSFSSSLVAIILSILVPLKAVCTVNNILRPFAAHRKRIAHHRPLLLPVERHHLAQIMDQSDQVQPIQFRILFPRPLSRLEGMDDIRQISVRIRLVHQVIEFLQGLPNRCTELAERQPLLVTAFVWE